MLPSDTPPRSPAMWRPTYPSPPTSATRMIPPETHAGIFFIFLSRSDLPVGVVSTAVARSDMQGTPGSGMEMRAGRAGRQRFPDSQGIHEEDESDVNLRRMP